MSEIICVIFTTLYLSYLSATTPPKAENKKDGNCSAKTVRPSIKAECVAV
jgi:hypothetical protein